MSFTRREILELGLKGTAAMALSLKAAQLPAADFNFSFSSLMDMTKFVDPDSRTLSYSVGSLCCKFCATKFIVRHYQPVAFVEVTRSDADSFATGGTVSDKATATISTDGKQNHSFQARVWDLPEIVTQLAFGLTHCRLCGKPPGVGNPADQIDPSALADLAAGICSSPADVVANEMKQALQGMYQQLLATMPGMDCIPKVLYDSASDSHWDTGCRDIALAQVAGPVCDIPGASAGMTVMDWIGGGSFNPCVGQWGSVLPRQKQVLNHDIQTAAALTAYRAIHVAKNTWKTFPYDASLRGKLQQTVPNASTGYSPGTNKMLFNLERTTSMNGRWVFVWWVPVSCCKDITDIAGVCPPPIPCF